jgi:polysaccharide export outer membrane protein
MRGFSSMGLALALCLVTASPWLTAQEAQPPAAQPQPAPEPVKPEVVETTKPMTVPAAVDPNSYKLGPDDVVFVRVWREPDLSGTMAVRPDGKITLPLINEIQASGLTPVQLGAEVTAALSKFVNNPQVMVAVQAVRSKRYYMSGEIQRAGAYPLASPTTIFEALTMAGGFHEFANKKKIMIIRGGKRFRFNWNQVVKGKNLEQNILLESGDQVIVP